MAEAAVVGERSVIARSEWLNEPDPAAGTAIYTAGRWRAVCRGRDGACGPVTAAAAAAVVGGWRPGTAAVGGQGSRVWSAAKEKVRVYAYHYCGMCNGRAAGSASAREESTRDERRGLRATRDLEPDARPVSAAAREIRCRDTSRKTIIEEQNNYNILLFFF